MLTLENIDRLNEKNLTEWGKPLSKLTITKETWDNIIHLPEVHHISKDILSYHNIYLYLLLI
jgi:hypothetical protein